MASQIIQTLITELTANGAQMRDELNRTLRETQSWGSRIGGMTKKIGIGIAAAGAGAAVGLGAMVKSSIDSADELSKLSQIVSVNIGKLSEYKYAADLSDVSLESFGKGLKIFNKNIVAAADGTGAQSDAFKALGIDIKNTDGSLKTTEQLFEDVTEGISRLEDSSTKTTLSMELFGKSGADLIPLLNGGRQGLKDAGNEAKRFGLVVSQEAGKAAEEFNDNLNRLGKSAEGVANLIAEEVTPTLADLTSTLQDPATQEGLASIASGIISIGAASIDALGKMGSFVKGTAEYIAGLDSGFASGDIEGKLKRITTLHAVLNKDFLSSDFIHGGTTDDFFKSREEVLKEIAKLQKEINSDYKSAPKPVVKPTEDKWAADAMAADEADKVQRKLATQKARQDGLKALQDEQKKLNDLVVSETAAMQEKLALSSDATELEKIQYRELAGDLQKATDAQKLKLEGLATELDYKKQMQELGEWAKQQYEEQKSILESLLTDEERINKIYDEKIEKVKKWGMTEQEVNDTVEKLNKKRTEELEKDNEKMSEITKNMLSDMQSGLGDAILDGLNGKSSDILSTFGDILKRMLADAVAADLMSAIFPSAAGGNKGSGVGDLLGGLGSLFGGMFAEGGRPPIGKMSVVGDGGEPELFVPDTAGTIIPFSKLGGGGSSISIGHMSFPGVTNAREAEMAAGAAARKMLGIMSSAQRYS